METKTGHEWFKTLPRHIQEQFKQNGIDQKKDLMTYLDEAKSGAAFISGHFTWSKAKEEDVYWLAIHNMYDRNKISSQDFEKLYEKYPEHSKKLESIINNYPIF